MKTPYFSYWDRQIIYADTLAGAILMVHLRFIQLFSKIVKHFSYTKFHDHRIKELKMENKFLRKKCNINAQILYEWQRNNMNN